ncbi:AIPR family protein [Oxalobacter aliiformigenes]|uniref:AIPR family protein n=1 Tax=Oxalobacter aliiformigenes TaxID=2946593 RepID=UPI0022AEA289|nr:AIPR family protein [Oxalobacter aliiformigenes]WAV90075.1 AIPR family protein [Oxalobacter aliiformigenes]
MEMSLDEFFQDFQQEIRIGGEADESSSNETFVRRVAEELEATGFVNEDIVYCHYRNPVKGLRIDAYSFDEEEGNLSLFIADYNNRPKLESLSLSEINLQFGRLVRFFRECAELRLKKDLEMTSPVYDFVELVENRISVIRKIRFFLLSERTLSERVKALDRDDVVCGISASWQVWDIYRLYQQDLSTGQREQLVIDFREMFGFAIPCLNVNLGTDSYQSYLAVMPGRILAGLYEKYDTRLLESNVRVFLQAKGKVNQGIRATILNEPEMFFAYNNGITATAREVFTERGENGLQIVKISDLQIVNGGQTTASLFHTGRKDKVQLENIFVQMKLSVIPEDQDERIVPNISRYANTQNKVNASDFFSNHPFSRRMEEMSRRIWAPAREAELRGSKWFFERTRGQYTEAQSKLAKKSELDRFRLENPKSQLFTKEKLAKYENVWDEEPRFVNAGSQKNFVKYAERISREWEKDSDGFNESYFRRAVARAIIFNQTENLVSKQEWYGGGYRANIVVYTIACLGKLIGDMGKVFPYEMIWKQQVMPASIIRILEICARYANDRIVNMPVRGKNVTEWCKQAQCWETMKAGLQELKRQLENTGLENILVSPEESARAEHDARTVQKMDNGIDAQTVVMKITGDEWARIRNELSLKRLITPKEDGILKIAAQIPRKIPNPRQSMDLLGLLERARTEGIKFQKSWKS